MVKMVEYQYSAIKEDEEVSGEDAYIVNKKKLIQEMPYADVVS